MAELRLTDAEKRCPRWLALDDDTLGKVVKASVGTLVGATDIQATKLMAACIVLIWGAVEHNSDCVTINVDGLTNKGEPLGDFVINIREKT